MNKTKFNKLSELCLEFTKGMMGDGTSKDKCYIVCIALVGYLEFVGYKGVQLVEGEVRGMHHYWIEIGQGKDLVMVDPTADQFKTPSGTVMPLVFVGHGRLSWYEPYLEAKQSLAVKDGKIIKTTSGLCDKCSNWSARLIRHPIDGWICNSCGEN